MATTIARTVHLHEGTPWRRYSLAGTAAEGDVMIATDGNGTRGVYRNGGYGDQLEWFDQPICPLELRR